MQLLAAQSQDFSFNISLNVKHMYKNNKSKFKMDKRLDLFGGRQMSEFTFTIMMFFFFWLFYFIFEKLNASNLWSSSFIWILARIPFILGLCLILPENFAKIYQ